MMGNYIGYSKTVGVLCIIPHIYFIIIILLIYSIGPNWGDNGNFKIRLGIDEMSIESSAEYANPVLINLTENNHEMRSYQYM